MNDDNNRPRAQQHRVAGYLSPGEEVVLATRQHPMAILGAFGSAVAWIIPIALVMWGVRGVEMLDNVVGDWIVRLLIVGMVIVLARLLWSVAGWEFERLVVTSEKVMHVHGIIAKRVASTPLVKVSETAVEQTVLGRMFGYGALVTDSIAGNSQPLHGLRYVPDPPAVYTLISDLGRRRRTEEGGGRLDEAATQQRPAPAPKPTDDDDPAGETRVLPES